MKNSVENITICKETYNYFHNQISKYLTNTIKKLPADKREEIDGDLQRNNYFINLGETNEFFDHTVLDTLCDFFQQHRRF